MAEDEEIGEESPKKKASGGMNTILMAAVAGVLVAVVFGAGIFIGVKVLGGSHDPAETKKEKKTEQASHGEEDEEFASAMDEDGNPLPKFIVSTGDITVALPQGHYVVVDLGLEVTSDESRSKMEKDYMIPIKHGVNKFFASYELQDFQRKELKDSLPLLVKKELRQYLGGIKVTNIYISKFITQ